MSCGAELRECSHESEGAATPLLGARYEEVCEEGVVGILCVGSVFLNGHNGRRNHGCTQGFRSFEVFRAGECIPSSISVLLACLVPPLSGPLSRNTYFLPC